MDWPEPVEDGDTGDLTFVVALGTSVPIPLTARGGGRLPC
jgi:hypothetical protein